MKITRTLKTVRVAVAALMVSMATAPLPLFAVPNAGNTPDAFVQYLQAPSTAGTYIESGIQGRVGTKAEARFRHAAPYSGSNHPCLLGSFLDDGTAQRFLLLGFYRDEMTLQYGTKFNSTTDGGRAVIYGKLTYGNDYTAQTEYAANGDLTGKTIDANGEVTTGAANWSASMGLIDTGLQMPIFAARKKTGNSGVITEGYFQGRLYRMKIWQTDANGSYHLVRDLLPCTKNNVAGLYDIVSETILLPAAGAFTAGDSVENPLAIWTGAADDGDAENAQNWTDGIGQAVIPTAEHDVIISGPGVNLQIPAGSNFACRSFSVGQCTFAADCDWRGLAVKPSLYGTADLAGHTLTLSGLTHLYGGAFDGTTGSTVKFTLDETNALAEFGEAAVIDDAPNLSMYGEARILLVKDGSGGTLSAAKMNLGDSSRVDFVQTNGEVRITGSANSEIGRAGGCGSYTITGGTLYCGNLHTGSAGEILHTGNNGEATLNIGGTASVDIYAVQTTGGLVEGENGRTYINIGGSASVTFRSYLSLAFGKLGGYTEVNQSGGSVVVNGTGDLSIGRWGRCVYNHSGGSITLNDSPATFYVGRGAGSSGEYNMTGGTLTAKQIFCQDGDSSVSFDGGTVSARSANAEFLKHLRNVSIGPRGLTLATNYDLGVSDVVLKIAPTSGLITLTGEGSLNLTGATFSIQSNPDSSRTLAVATGSGIFTGAPELSGANGWRLGITANGKVVRLFKAGMVIVVR